MRVTQKDDMRTYTNAKGEGKVFSMDLLDREGTEIRATCFNDAVDKWYSVFQVGKVYKISGGSVKPARKQYTRIENDYSIILRANSKIELLRDEADDISKQKYDFAKVRDVAESSPNDTLDLLVIVESVEEMDEINSKKVGRMLKRRNMIVFDETAKIQVSLWSTLAENYDAALVAQVIALKGARVSDFNGKSLSAGQIIVGPEVTQAAVLKKWWVDVQSGGTAPVLVNMSTGCGGRPAPYMCLDRAKELGIGRNEDFERAHGEGTKAKGEVFECVGTITAISHSPDKPPWYKACPKGSGEKFKVQEDGHGKWFCERNQKVYDTYYPRYVVRFCVSDFAGQEWMVAFHEIAEQILGVPSETAHGFLAEGNNKAFEKIFTEACFKRWKFKVRARMDVYQVMYPFVSSFLCFK